MIYNRPITRYNENNFNEIFKNKKINCSKLATVVEGDPKAPFWIAIIPRCRGGLYSFRRIDPLYPWYVPYIAEC